MEFELIRYAYLPTATLGVMRLDGLTLQSIERPWIANPAGPGGKLSESCVPDGRYTVRVHESAKYSGANFVYAIANPTLGVNWPGALPARREHGRDAILIHPANEARELLGCIAPGMVSGPGLSVLRSGEAMEHIRARLGRGPLQHVLRIRPCSGTVEELWQK